VPFNCHKWGLFIRLMYTPQFSIICNAARTLPVRRWRECASRREKWGNVREGGMVRKGAETERAKSGERWDGKSGGRCPT